MIPVPVNRTVAAGIVFYLADAMDASFRWLDQALAVDTHTSGTVLTALVPLLSSAVGLLARSAAETNARPSPARAFVQATTLPAITIVLLASLAWANLRAVEALEYHYLNDVKCTPAMGAVNDQCHPGGAGIGERLRFLLTPGSDPPPPGRHRRAVERDFPELPRSAVDELVACHLFPHVAGVISGTGADGKGAKALSAAGKRLCI